MKSILGFLKDYIFNIDKRAFYFSALFAGIFIFINYYFHLNKSISSLGFFEKFIAWYLIFLLAFTLPYFISFFFKKHYPLNLQFYLLLIIAPALFAWKISASLPFPISTDNYENIYWNKVLYWPVKLLIVSFLLFLVWWVFKGDKSLYGLRIKTLNWKPYLLMLAIMVPLIAVASTQPDFLLVYPKLKNVHFLSEKQNGIGYKFLYELSYGSDFFTIELFFRGFLVIAFARWVGKDAILPMAVFYCTIHFGKPLGECISSFFGGIILGVITFHTRSIYGGLIVHLGIAWMMELGGYLGNAFVGK